MTVTGIIAEVIDEMCANYCKYAEESAEHIDNDNFPEGTPCENCPLYRL